LPTVIQQLPESGVKLHRQAGVVYTKPWLVEVILDLAGYTPDKPLATLVALEPSAGDGAFLCGMVRRLVESCKRHRTPLSEANEALRAYDIDSIAIASATETVHAELIRLGVEAKTASLLARAWIREEDFLEASLGFPVADFVIGNPPYIRLEEIPEEKALLYRNAYSTMRGRADIYVAFFQAALAQLRPRGVCAYICADRWLLNDYGRALRMFITAGYSVRYVVETHDVDAFESEVSAYPAITVISHEKQGPVVVAKALPGIETAETDYVVSHLKAARSNTVVRAARFNDWFKGDEPWPCSSPEMLAFLKDLEAKFPLLESEETGTKVGIGVATGADSVFVTQEQPDIEKDRLLPLAMAFDLAGGKVEWSGHYLVNPWNEKGLVDLGDYPRMAHYLEPFRTQLIGRHTAKDRPGTFHRTIDRVSLSLLSQRKLYIADIRDRLTPSLDEGKTYPHHNVYWITSRSWDLRVLGALLMSEVGEFFIRCYGVRMRGGYFRFQAQYLRRIRVPNPQTISKSIAARLVRAFDSGDLSLANEAALELYGIRSLPHTH
jgi:adenine-specific DNA-methyltransferase